MAAAYCAAAHEVEGQRSSFDALTTSLLAVGDWPALFALGSNTLECAPSWSQKSEAQALQARALEHMQLDSVDAQSRARDLIARANTALANSDTEAAVDYLEQAGAAVDDAWVSARHGQVLAQLGRSIEAERAFSRARAQLRQLGTPPAMSLPDRYPTFGWDGRRLAIMQDQHLTLLEGPIDAMQVRWSRRLGTSNVGLWMRFEPSDTLQFFGEELAVNSGAVVRVSDGQPFLLHFVGIPLFDPPSQEQMLEQIRLANVRGTSAERELRYSSLAFPAAPLVDPSPDTYPLTPRVELDAAFDEACRRTRQGVLCLTAGGVVRRVPQTPDLPFGGRSRDEVVLPLTSEQSVKGVLSGDGRRLVRVVDHSLRITAVESGKELRSFALRDVVEKVVASFDGRRVALIAPHGQRTSLILVDVERRRLVNAPEQMRKVYDVWFSPDGNTVLADGEEGYLLRVERNVVLPLPDFHRAQFAADGSSFALEGSRMLRFFDTTTGRALASYTLPLARVQTLAMYEDTLMLGLCDGTVRTLDTKTGAVGAFAPLSKTRRVCIEQLSVDSKGHRLLTGEPGELRAWDLRSETELWRAAADNLSLSSVASSRDGSTLAIGRNDGSVQMRSWTSGAVTGEYAAAATAITSTALSPSGRELAAADSAGTLHFIELASGDTKRSEHRNTRVLQLEYVNEHTLDLASVDGLSRMDLQNQRTVTLTRRGNRAFCRARDGSFVIGGGDVGAELITFGVSQNGSTDDSNPDSFDDRTEKQRLDGPDWDGPCSVLPGDALVAYVTESGSLGLSATRRLETPSVVDDAESEGLPFLGTLTFGRELGWAFLSANGTVTGNRPELLDVRTVNGKETLPSEVGWGAFTADDALVSALHGELVASPWHAAIGSARQ